MRGLGCGICKGGVKLTEKDVINYINKNYPKKYDLSLFKYKNSKTQVIVIDPKYKTKHLMSWGSLKKGTECSLINAENKNEYLILLFIERHGQLYDYSFVKYKNENKKVTIVCKIHGDFKQTAKSHISGSGCPKCQHKGFSKKEIIDQLNKVHNYKYDYSKLNYQNQNSKVIIICKDHGEFKQNLTKHKLGAGCRKCAGLDISNDEILKKFFVKHGDQYDYSKVQYESALKKVIIVCKKHGEFKQTANNHIYGNGCPKCGGRERKTKKEILEEFYLVHNDRYDYSKVKYSNTETKVEIICNIHGSFFNLLITTKGERVVQFVTRDGENKI